MPSLVNPKIKAVIEYSEDGDEISFEVFYNGAVNSPEDSDNKLSYGILRNVASAIIHEAYNGQDYSNKVKMLFKQ